jgi:RND family efflux transporter MFP subunit
MKTTAQIALSAIVVATAAAGVALQQRSGEAGRTVAEEGGHDHAAMMAGGGAMQPVLLDDEAARRIGVTFATVEYRELTSTLRSVGMVTFDETRLATVSPKVDGWVEHLFVDFTGAPVHAGEPLFTVYSPALVTAQEELLLAARAAVGAEGERARTSATEMLEAVRRRLSYWDVPQSEIERIEAAGSPDRTLTLNAPASGIVVEKNVVEGDRIMPGQTIFRIADLSRVWVEAEVFENDLAQIGLGQHAAVTFQAYAGRTYEAAVTYVHPTVSLQSRTARVRLEMPNPRGELKPGMFAALAFHSLPTAPTLVVPRSAVIATGVRSLTFVQAADGALRAREVVPGRTSGRLMEILEGLEAGERVVSSAAFLVDAESNLGRMTGETGGSETDEIDGMAEMDHSAMPAAPDTAGDPPAAHQR